MNNSITAGLSFLLLSISATISSNAINIFCCLFGFYASILLQISSISFEHSIKALESFKYFMSLLFLLLISNFNFHSYRSSAYK